MDANTSDLVEIEFYTLDEARQKCRSINSKYDNDVNCFDYICLVEKKSASRENKAETWEVEK